MQREMQHALYPVVPANGREVLYCIVAPFRGGHNTIQRPPWLQRARLQAGQLPWYNGKDTVRPEGPGRSRAGGSRP